MKIIYLIFSLLFFSSLASAASINIPSEEIITNSTCLSSSLLWTNSTVQYALNENGTLNNTTIQKILIRTCPTGCSTTLNDCRSSNPMQIIWFSATIMGMILMIWFFDSIGWAGYALDFLLIIITMTFATFDIFSYAWMTTIYLVMIFVIFTAMLIRFAAAERGKVKDDEYGEQG